MTICEQRESVVKEGDGSGGGANRGKGEEGVGRRKIVDK
jgi:hypothetical protein